MKKLRRIIERVTGKRRRRSAMRIEMMRAYIRTKGSWDNLGAVVVETGLRAPESTWKSNLEYLKHKKFV